MHVNKLTTEIQEHTLHDLLISLDLPIVRYLLTGEKLTDTGGNN